MKISFAFAVWLAMAPLASYAQTEGGEDHATEEFDGDNTEPPEPRAPKVNREKKAEGTPARDRFEAETVIKSRYGSLDVDPD